MGNINQGLNNNGNDNMNDAEGVIESAVKNVPQCFCCESEDNLVEYADKYLCECCLEEFNRSCDIKNL